MNSHIKRNTCTRTHKSYFKLLFVEFAFVVQITCEAVPQIRMIQLLKYCSIFAIRAPTINVKAI